MLFDAQKDARSRFDILRSGRFSRPRFVADTIGFAVASYAIGLIGYVINNLSHTPSTFSHAAVLFLAVVFVAICYLISRKFGNTRYIGIKTVLATTLAGSFSAAVLSATVSTVVHGSSGAVDSGLGLISAIFFTMVAFPIAMIVRLIATPIVNIFEPDRSFNIPHS